MLDALSLSLLRDDNILCKPLNPKGNFVCQGGCNLGTYFCEETRDLHLICVHKFLIRVTNMVSFYLVEQGRRSLVRLPADPVYLVLAGL